MKTSSHSIGFSGEQLGSNVMDPVWSKYSCGLARVVFEQPTQPFTALYRAVILAYWSGSCTRPLRINTPGSPRHGIPGGPLLHATGVSLVHAVERSCRQQQEEASESPTPQERARAEAVEYARYPLLRRQDQKPLFLGVAGAVATGCTTGCGVRCMGTG